MLAFNDIEPADTAANMNAHASGVFFSHLEAGHLHGFIAGGERQMDEAAHLLDLFFLNELQRIKVLDLSGNGAGEVGGIEMGDGGNAALARLQVLPDFRGGMADGANETHASNNNTSIRVN